MADADTLRTSTLFFPFFLLLTTCAENPIKETVPSDATNLGCTTSFSFDDGTGDGSSGILCIVTDYEEYGDKWVGMYHYRCGSDGSCDWWFYYEVDVQSVCENVLCNLEPSSLCVSAAQFWSTGDGWQYAVCRIGSTPADETMAFWRRYGNSGEYTLMEEQLLVYYCEQE